MSCDSKGFNWCKYLVTLYRKDALYFQLQKLDKSSNGNMHLDELKCTNHCICHNTGLLVQAINKKKQKQNWLKETYIEICDNQVILYQCQCENLVSFH